MFFFGKRGYKIVSVVNPLKNLRKRMIIISIPFVMFYCVLIYRITWFAVQKKDIKIQKVTVIQEISNDIRGIDFFDAQGKRLTYNSQSTSVFMNPKKIEDSKAVKKLVIQELGLTKSKLNAIISSQKNFVWLKRKVDDIVANKLSSSGIKGIGFLREYKRTYVFGSLFSHFLGYVGIDNYGLSGLELSGAELPKDTKLSLDVRFQYAVKSELKSVLEMYDPKNAVGIILNVNTGKILASVSLPDFDPNDLSSITEASKFNASMMGVYEFGSVMKPFTLAAALDSGAIKIDDRIEAQKFVYAGNVISDFPDLNGKQIGVRDIIIRSSNVGMARIAMKIKSIQLDYLYKFGFFSPLEMAFKEKAKVSFRDHWSMLKSITASYGYGIAVSPMHVAQAGAALVNGGLMYPASYLADDKKEPVRVINRETSELLKSMLRDVVLRGTGKSAQLRCPAIAGKTGTANKSIAGGYRTDKVVASFMAFFPAEEPSYVIFIMVDEPKNTRGFGGTVAAPVAARIAKRIADIEGICK